MGLSKKAMDDIANLALDGGGDSGIRLSKQQTTPEVGHLIVSLGGSGADMIREAKGLIYQNCSSDDDKYKKPERVAFLAFDTDRNEMNKVSQIKTGQVKLDENELIILSDAELSVLLDQTIKDYNRSNYPWIYRWLDTEIPVLSGGNGAGGCRQAGRAMLFLEIDKVVSNLEAALSRLIKGTRVKSLNIYLLSGVSGGTGSGTFLDMAYLLRYVADKTLGKGPYKGTNINIYGYLIMPDVNLENADEMSKPGILKNAGAALQELDHAMRLPEVKDFYECQYSQTITVITDKAPFNYVHLICRKAQGAGMHAEPYLHCLDTVAGSILCFVSGMKKSNDGNNSGVQASAEFPVDAYYSNIKTLRSNSKGQYKERSNCYISVGYDCWEIPADRLVKYIFTLMFSKVNDLFKNEPTQEDANKIMENLGLFYETKMLDLMGGMRDQLSPAQFTNKQLFGKEALNLDLYLPYEPVIAQIDKAYEDSFKNYNNQIQRVLQDAYKDVERGPIWTNHVIVSGTSAHINALDKLLIEQKSQAITCRSNLFLERENLLLEINRMSSTYKAKAKQSQCQEFIMAWNNFFRATMKIHCLDLMIGDKDTLRNVNFEQKFGLYDTLHNMVAELNNNWLDVTRQVLEELKNIVQKNTEGFKNAAVETHARGFNWRAGEIPNLDKAIGDIMAKNGIDHSSLMNKFLVKLLDNADQWSRSVDIRKFIEEFLEVEAKSVLNVSLEGLLRACFAGEKPLADSVKDDLMPYMVENAKPLFDGNRENKFAGNITIPAGCEEIEKGVNDYADNKDSSGTFNIETSFLRNRISVICTAVGISLHDYSLYEECEKQIGLDPNVRGLFLNQGEEDFEGTANHMKMPLPLVIPTRKRGKTSSAPDTFKKFEEQLIEEFRTMRREEYPFLQFKKTPNGQDYDLHLQLSEELINTDFYAKIQEDTLKKKSNRNEFDPQKVKNLVDYLKEIRYKTGLPDKKTLPNHLIICNNLLSCATKIMQERYSNLLSQDAERVKEEVAWEVAEWYYVSYYNFYMYAKAEKAKYDEIEKAIKRFESILDDLEQKPMRCATMARMLASGAVKYDEKLSRYTYKVGGKDVPIVEVEAAYLRVKDLALYEALEKLRTGDDEDKYLYNELCHRAYDNYDALVEEYYLKAYDEKDKRSGKFPETAEYIRKFIELYKKIDYIRTEVKAKWEAIAAKLRMRDHVDNAAENPKTKEFYEAYYQGLDRYIKQDGKIAACTEKLKIRGADDNMLPEDEIFEKKIEEDRKETGGDGNTWTCPKCGRTGNTEPFCPGCGFQKPVPVITWTCPKCGRTGNKDPFCPGCGFQKPADEWTCPKCGRTGNKDLFCPGCGFRKPAGMVAPTREWTCPNCGRTGNTEPFCPGCGFKKP